MKISETTSFPFPVLAPWSDDIEGSTIAADITFREERETNQVTLRCAASVTQPEISELINKGLATFGCYVKCIETGLRRLQPMSFPIGLHDFAPGALLGHVHIRPMVWTVSNVHSYRPTGLHPEYLGDFDIGPGVILALDEEQVIEVSRPPLPSVESIFEIKSSEEIVEGKFEIDSASDRVIVRMNPKTYALVQRLRHFDEATRIVITNSLYIPMVMQVLSDLFDTGFEPFEKYRWLHPFRTRCEQLRIDVNNLDLLSDAQALLENPFAALGLLVEDVEESSNEAQHAAT
ncbi:MAG: hypothetical protein ABIP46_06695 [Polaromonas sp.]